VKAEKKWAEFSYVGDVIRIFTEIFRNTRIQQLTALAIL
jgi:hypothetical protein